ncbi:MAG: hypothetical protein KDB69_08910 [Acidimicrobiia bacterium]|nr:hypothetical protein [Acidimicrobiia bacterium]
MDLNAFDDYPFHQGFAPLHVPATSDSHYNDGYWFGWYRGDKYFFAGMRLHPNNNVMDGYAGLVAGEEQTNLRVSRALLPNHSETTVGPLSVQILEPMKRIRLRLEPNETGVTFDVEVTHAAPMYLEAPHIQYRYGRVLNRLNRYSGPTWVTGTAVHDGVEIEIDNWHGARDHSWGVRSTMGPYVPIGGVEEKRADPRAMRLWFPFAVEGHAGFFHTHENMYVDTLDFEGRIVYDDGRVVDLTSVEHRFRYHPGTRRIKAGDVEVWTTAGDRLEYSFEVVAHAVHPQGFGYTRGWFDRGQPGVFRGVSYSEWDRFVVSDPAKALGPEHIEPEDRLGGTEFSADLVGPDGAKGMVMVEHMLYGRYDPYGFE